MLNVRLSCCTLLLLVSTSAAWGGPVQLDFLRGDWIILDQSGKQIGQAHIDVQQPGAMIYARRSDQEGELPVWFVNSEARGGWTQLFPAPGGVLREFGPVSKSGEWPLILGTDTTLRDGRHVRFRLTIERESDDKSRRLLEMSADKGVSWQTVFDYRYQRRQTL